MTIIVGLALGLILGGLLMARYSPSMSSSTMISVVYYVGIALVIVGLILLLAPVVAWLNVQLRGMLNV